jgi:hypothetical protein
MPHPLRAVVVVGLLVVHPLVLEAAPRNRDPAIDRYALKASKKAEATLESLVKYLVKPAKNDREKVRAIFRWVADRLQYDAAALFAGKPGDNSAATVFKTRKCVCGGYANLMKAMCDEAGIEAVVIIGKARGFGSEVGRPKASGHAWNAVKLDDKWCLLDATWAGRGLEKQKSLRTFKPYYFLVPPEELILTHFPKESRWQLVESPMSEETFDKQPYVPPMLLHVGFTRQAIQKEMDREGFKEFVKAAPFPNKTFKVRAAPVGLHLKPGSKHRFSLEAPEAVLMAFHDGTRFHPLRRKGKTFEGILQVPADAKIYVGVQWRSQKQKNVYYNILEYLSR